VAYVTLEQVLRQAPQVKISATSKPNTQEAAEIVAAVEAYVNSVLKGLGYVTPLDGTTSPKAVGIVKDIIIQGSIARILKAMFYGVRNPNDVGANDAFNEFKLKLAQLSNQSDPMVLEDAVLTGVAVHAVAELDSNISDFVLEDEMFRPTRDQVF
jgi:hypothetical protein